MRWTILLSNAAAYHDRSLQGLFYLLGRGLPQIVAVEVQSFAEEFSGTAFSKAVNG